MKAAADLVVRRGLGRGVVQLSLNQPGSFNALSAAMMQALALELDDVSKCVETKVVVLTGNGKAFCTGHDIKEIMSVGPDKPTYDALFASCSALMMQIRSLPQPVIARVDGVATAAGCQLVSMCDLAVASVESTFATSGINYGLFCSTPAVGISRTMHPKQAFDMLVTGDFITAEEAVRRGLINQTVDKSELDSRVLQLSTKIASQPSNAVQDGKKLFYKQLQLNIEDAYSIAGEEMASKMCQAEARAGFDAFLNKVPPPWRKE